MSIVPALRIVVLCLLVLCPLLASAVEPSGNAWDERSEAFEDAQLDEELVHPDWFALSFLDLPGDLREAVAAGKRGLIVYFGQRFCPYCQALMQADFGRPDIETFTRRHFDVVAVNIHGNRPVTDMAGVETTERELAEREGAEFTPTLLFHDAQGRKALVLRGFYPPYKFRAALDYVVGGHYLKESFPTFLNRADPPLTFELGGLNEEEFFQRPPYALDRTRIPGEKPLIVFFEQGECHACDILHTKALQRPEIRELLERFETVQLDMWSDAPVVTPEGRRTSARDWAGELGLFYTPTLIFFDENGREIMRIDSVAYFYRLQRVLLYVLSGAWTQGISLHGWRWQAERELVLDQEQ